MKELFLALSLAALLTAAASAEEYVRLPDPVKEGGMTLLEALVNRRSAREFAEADLNHQQLSNLLWATAGVNRTENLRVHPVAMGIQDTTVYVVNSAGIYKYDPTKNVLRLVREGDHRSAMGMQPFAGKAAVNLAYVHDASLWEGKSKAPKETVFGWGFAHTGAMMQNAYLYAASQGWNAVVRGSFDPAKVAGLLKLGKNQSVTLIQSIGPKL